MQASSSEKGVKQEILDRGDSTEQNSVRLRTIRPIVVDIQCSGIFVTLLEQECYVEPGNRSHESAIHRLLKSSSGICPRFTRSTFSFFGSSQSSFIDRAVQPSSTIIYYAAVRYGQVSSTRPAQANSVIIGSEQAKTRYRVEGRLTAATQLSQQRPVAAVVRRQKFSVSYGCRH
ncbi:hypothetical protein BDV96DRAFT_598321 [Lophiotrema nucula]|uniref:Uncharacterized protein n=1 Tax=Lophiotrema nucula TaxID=690887 RepID=A0A6A5ZD24_9PLEO|nr:hypothetical protein BDV96DRAFT_598321 [Lophiotrema nucula]